MIYAKFLHLNVIPDLTKGFVVAVFTSGITACSTMLSSGQLPDKSDLKTIGLAALAAGLGYILKNLLTNSEGKMMKKDPPQNL